MGAPIAIGSAVMQVLDAVTLATWQYIVLPFVKIFLPVVVILWLLVLFLWIRNKKNKK